MLSPPDRTVRVLVDDRPLDVPEGTIVSAALARAGGFDSRVSVSGEPRGPLCGMGTCFECRVVVDGVPHTRGCQTVCVDGMEIRRQMTDGCAFPISSAVRSRSGAGGASSSNEAGAESRPASGFRDASEFDLVIVGAGPAGIFAAALATQAGLSVCLLDNNPGPGGQIWRSGSAGALPPAARSHWRSIDASRLDYRSGTTVFEASPVHRSLRTWDGAVAGVVRYRQLLLATGARERFLPFPGWTLPGVFGVGGLQALAKGGWPVAGKRIVLAGTGPLLLAVAHSMRERGAKVQVLEQTSTRRWLRFGLRVLAHREKWRDTVSFGRGLRGMPFSRNAWPVGADRSDSEDGALTVRVMRSGRIETLRCDYLAVGFGLVPNLELAEHLGLDTEPLEGDVQPFVRVDRDQRTSRPEVYAAGEITGIGGVEIALLEARIAACAIVGREPPEALRAETERAQRFVQALAEGFELREELREIVEPSTVVCRCEDVRSDEFRRFPEWRSAKLHTRCGMGPCQGRVCGAALEFLHGWRPSSVRPPLFPVPAEVYRVDPCARPLEE